MTYPCSRDRLEDFISYCYGDNDYACLRYFRQNLDLKPLFIKEFVSQFKRYEHDRDNFSLFIWGYVMPLLDYYKTHGKIVSSEGEATIYG